MHNAKKSAFTCILGIKSTFRDPLLLHHDYPEFSHESYQREYARSYSLSRNKVGAHVPLNDACPLDVSTGLYIPTLYSYVLRCHLAHFI